MPIETEINYCVLIPTYNNASKIRPVLEKVGLYASNVIVINDGATDSTAEILADFPQYDVIIHEVNQGKGVALRHGFERAITLGYDYAITIDSDGQHDAADIPKIIAAIEQNPGAVVMGSRNMEQAGVPGKSSFGNKFSNFWFWAETGISLPDTQTGFRAYPLHPISKKKWITSKFEFEIEVIVRLAWSNIPFVSVPIHVTYEEDRITHFRMFRDFARISVLNTFLVTLALLFFLPRLLIMRFSFQKSWEKLKVEFGKNKDNPGKMAFSVGLGLFFGIFPVWGFQMLIAFGVASVFKLNRLVVLFFSNISIPPFLPILIFVSFLCGAPFVADPVQFSDFTHLTLDSVYDQVVQYAIGSVLFSVAAGLIGTLVAYILLKWAKAK
ncbi:DUF2062 domain-containing protein [Reichenbachiella agarivorans]|uniref:DUF2062 domain-containing protein n=1 Tax=Reichenbachiella agarivorans TaxID=2979464 RepID=A0ABY6CL15_9BACT|nr:DUF2062 domain-containing protein [Reichenbachiella agarivorans]UXP30775.1 DUF2062 domain-containing protein [Reichenbachiella agarivorans]